MYKTKQRFRLGIVVPRFGENVSGGAELFGKWLAERLSGVGHSVDVFTTCAIDHRHWRNDLSAGIEHHGNVTVRRFPVRERDLGIHGELDRAIMTGYPLSDEEETLWLRHGVSSDEMEEDIRRTGGTFDAIMALPYLFGTSYFAFKASPDNFVLIPCLHDEPYADLRFVRRMLSNALGVMFNSNAEAELGRELGADVERSHVVGIGVSKPAASAPDGSRSASSRPSILYVGRRELGKNTPLLIEYFTRYQSRRKGSGLTLVLAGSGDDPPDRPDVVVREPDWTSNAMYRDATIFCQPSFNESFSIVLMQAWLAGTPAIVHGSSPVMREHCERSNGGLWFTSYAEFEETLDLLLASDDLRARLGANGKAYAEREYSWDVVLSRFDAAMRRLLEREVSGIATQQG